MNHYASSIQSDQIDRKTILDSMYRVGKINILNVYFVTSRQIVFYKILKCF